MKFRKYKVVTNIKDFKTVMGKYGLQLWGKLENEDKFGRMYILGVDGEEYGVLSLKSVEPLIEDLKDKKLSIIKVKKLFLFETYYITPTKEIRELDENNKYNNKQFTIREEDRDE